MGVDLTSDTPVKIFADNFSVIRSEPRIPLCGAYLQLSNKIKAIRMVSKISKDYM